MNPIPVPQLRILLGLEQEKVILLDKPEMVIGRDLSADLTFADPAISRRHARIHQVDQQYLVEDMGSSNGTFINGKRLLGSQVLQPGDEILLGEVAKMRFEAQLDRGKTQALSQMPLADEAPAELFQTMIMPEAATAEAAPPRTPTIPDRPIGEVLRPKANPYVGPRSFETGETIYGRDRHIRQIFELLVASRIMVLHSPSGAGKSSLVKAGLIPRLKNSGYQVYSVIRVNLERPVELLKGDDTAAFQSRFNRYAFSAMLSLDEALPEEKRTPVQHLAVARLPDYLAARARQENEPVKRVLIFDQFEEILTIAPNDLVGKHAFFEQVGQALQDPQLWALFMVREDFLAALDPYLRPVPTRLANTHRLDLLNVDNARQAIQKPAQGLGVEFSDQAAQKLIDDLRMIQVQQLDGSMTSEPGPYVEPVQLQVVCYRLWENLLPGQISIDEKDLAAVGDVNRSLADYYSSTVAGAASKSGIGERQIREWFDEKLITGGIRNQVLKTPDSSGGLDNLAIQALVDAHIVRAEQRAGATWFEMAHDRLIKPVQENNKAWFEQNLSLLQRQASLWDSSGRPDGLLLQGNTLNEAEAWAAGQSGATSENLRQVIQAGATASGAAHGLTSEERDFLGACWSARDRRKRERLRSRVIAGLAIGAAVLALVAVILLGYVGRQGLQLRAEKERAEANYAAAETSKQEAEQEKAQAVAAKKLAEEREAQAEASAIEAGRQAQRALNSQIISQSKAILDDYPQRSLLLAIEAGRMAAGTDDQAVGQSRQALVDALRATSGRGLVGHTDLVSTADISPDGKLLATAGKDGTIRLWDLENQEAASTILEGHEDWINIVTFSPDGRWLASGSDDGAARLWDLQNPGSEPAILNTNAAVYDAVFSPDGQFLATNASGTPQIWNVQDPAAEPLLPESTGAWIDSMSFTPDGRHLVAAYGDSIRLWRMDRLLSGTRNTAFDLGSGKIDAFTYAISPDSRWLATVQYNNVALWDLVAQNEEPYLLKGHDVWISTLAFSPDSKTLVSGSDDGTLRLWDMENRNETGQMLSGHTGWVKEVAFVPGGRWVASMSDDQTVRVWDTYNPKIKPLVLFGHEGIIYDMAISSDGRWLSTTSADKTARVWDIQAALNTGFTDLGSVPIGLRGYTGALDALAISPDGRWLAAGNGGSLLLWDRTDPAFAPISLPEGLGITDGLVFSQDNRELISAGWYYDDALKEWKNVAQVWPIEELIANPETPPQRFFGHTDLISNVTTSPGGRWLATASDDLTARVYDLQNPQAEPFVLEGFADSIASMRFDPDGNWLAVVSHDRTARLWDINQLRANPKAEPIILADPEGAGVWWKVDFSPDGRWLVIASSENGVNLYDFKQLAKDPQTAPLTLSMGGGGAGSIAFSPNGKWLAAGRAGTSAAGSSEYNTRLWDLEALASNPQLEPKVLSGHRRAIVDLAFSPDGNWLASASRDKTAMLWDMQIIEKGNLPEPLTLRGHADDIRALTFTPDSQWLATASWDQSVLLWLLNSEEQTATGCQVAGRNLTEQEWAQYFGDVPYRKICPDLP